MLLREASLMRSLHHPNVLRLHAAFLVGDAAWLVLPLVAGGCVSAALERRARRMSGSHASSSGSAAARRRAGPTSLERCTRCRCRGRARRTAGIPLYRELP